MTGFNYPIPSSYYGVCDLGSNDPACYFDSLTGGDQKISLVQYNVTDGKGNITTKFMPGQTSFEPVSLLRAMDSYSTDMNIMFQKAIAGILVSVRKNYSIYMYDSNGVPLVWWDLYNAVPVSISGFSFNASKEKNYTDFEISFQAENIIINFAPEGDWAVKE
jgi:phage tail-like protein